ncbi:MAG: TIGR00282 family metallophosphoesterase [Chthoniobacterales bacterium]|nr:TIGR00282 family metallophosphoesterase [Chthoniobacterales bacterium]
MFFGDIVGEPGRSTIIENLASIKEEFKIDFFVANGENAAGGKGITPKIAIDLLRCGIAVITTGDHVWDQKDLAQWISTEPRVLRPINYPAGTPGAGSIVLETAKGKVGVLNAQCRTFMKQLLENPFDRLRQEIEILRTETNVLLVDVHGETTSEKAALAWHLDGKVSAVIGTHTHVQTADERILPNGTAFLTDVGMCGADISILGREPAVVLQKFLTSMPTQLHIARGDVRICAAILDIDELTGRALSIQRFQRLYKVS